MRNPGRPPARACALPALMLLMCSLETPAYAGTIFLQSSTTSGVSSVAASYLVEDHRLNIADTYTQGAAGAGTISTVYANVKWTGAFGSLHAFAGSGLPNSPDINGSYANIGLEWTDYLQLTRLDPNAPAPSFQITALLHGTQTLDLDPNLQSGSVFAGAGLDDALAGINLIQTETCTDLGWCIPELFDDQGIGSSSTTATVLGCNPPGCWVGLHGWMELEARTIFLSGTSGEASQPALVQADYLHSATFKLDLLTPGWTVSSLSGTNYSSASSEAPEATTSLLCGAGLLAAVIFRRR